ncbi:hypothetical protein [Actinomadura sp. 6N118]|uniref:hypothetical protein n=1 Tax=Actinomadura sp. 6N118 TaxID=3375151 RepID=UPI00378763E6
MIIADDFAVVARDPGVALEMVRAADWDAFAPERDLPPLRDALAALERAHGVTEAHRHATAKIKAYGALLRHADTHRAELLTHVLSPCGRYLAIGSAVGEEFDDGGVLQVWEVATGRCVNVIDRIPGGVGWESARHMIQWSADASRIAVVHDKSMVGVWEPFRDQEGLWGAPIVQVDVSDSRPRFAFAPDGERVVMWGGWHRKDQRGRLFPLDDVEAVEALVPVESLSDEMLAVLDGEPLSLDWSAWSKDGERVYGVYRYEASGWGCSIDVAARRVVWLRDTHDLDGPLPAWSPDERAPCPPAERSADDQRRGDRGTGGGARCPPGCRTALLGPGRTAGDRDARRQRRRRTPEREHRQGDRRARLRLGSGAQPDGVQHARPHRVGMVAGRRPRRLPDRRGPDRDLGLG